MSDTFTPREQDSARAPSNISTREWGEQNRELSVLTSASAGRWSIVAVPFMSMILDALDDEDVEMVALQKSSQIAGTETILTWLGKVADQDPGPAMMVFADEDTAKEIVERRLMPMFRTSRPLARQIEAAKFNKESITLQNNFSLTPAWASSIGKTASRPIRNLYCSEITKPGYGKMGAEGAVISRIIQRTETFPNKKLVFESSPTIEGDNMTQVMGLCEALYDWHVPCPFCGCEQPLRFSPQDYLNSAGEKRTSGQVIFDDPEPGIDRATAARLAGETARYECGECKARWTTAEKNAAVSRGRKVPRAPITKKPKRVGFYLSRLYSLFPGGRLESLAEAFLLAKDSPDELQVFVNNALGEHWKRHKIQHTEDQLRAIETDLPAGMVPDAADCLVATVDMQMHGFWFTVRAWQASPRKSWLVECGELGSWEDLGNLLFERTWQNAAGKHYNIWRSGIDSGGGKDEESLISRTEELYDWYIKNLQRAYGKVFLCKGSSRAMPQILNLGKILVSTPNGKKIDRYGLRILTLSTNDLKRLFLHGIKQAIEGGSGAAHAHKDTPRHYYRHITAEAQNDAGDFERLRPDNHLFDCEATQYAMTNRLLFGGADRFIRGAAPKPQAQPTAAREQQPTIPAPPTSNPFTTGSTGTGNPFTGR